GSVQIFISVPGADSLITTFIAQVGSGGNRVHSVSVRDLSVTMGKYAAPDIAWEPTDPSSTEFSLTSDKPGIARIVGQRIHGEAPGTASITLVSLDGGHQAVFTATVANAPVSVYAKSVFAEDMYLVYGAAAETPKLQWSPASVTDKDYRLISTDSNVASVRERIKIYPKGIGAARVYVIGLDGSGVSADFGVSVAAEAVPVTGIRAGPISLVSGADPAPPVLTWVPAGATNRKYTLASGDTVVAQARNGLIKPISMGIAQFVVTTDDGAFKDTFSVTIGRPDTSVHVDSVRVADLSVPLGTDKKPAIIWFPADAGDQNYALASLDSNVAKANGSSVHPVAVGSADFRLTTADGRRTAVFKVSVYQPEIPVQAISADTLYLVVDDQQDPKLTWSPSNATNRKYTLQSLDAKTNIVNGVSVHAQAVGNSKVQVTSADGPVSIFPVVISAKTVKLVSLGCTSFSINLGDAPRVPAMVYNPPSATDKSVTFSTAAGGAISINPQNQVVAISAGKARLTAVSGENPGIAASCSVTVAALVKSVQAKDDTLRLGAGEKDATPGLTWDPPDATDKSFSLYSNDTDIVKINGKNYKAVGEGRTTVVVKAMDGSGKADTFSVWVQIPVTGITALNHAMKTTDSVSVAPSVSIAPANATERNWYLVYTYPNASPAPNAVIKIVSGWQLLPVGPGQASLTAIAVDNPAIRDTFVVTVTRPVTGITASPVGIKLGEADKDAIITFAPADASDKTYLLTSASPAVASVVMNKIHAVAAGTAVFTGTSTDGSKTAVFQVSVTVPVVSITATDLNMKMGDPAREPAITWNPAGASNKGYTMVSSHPLVVSINASNKLQAASAGTAVITVTTADGSKTATFTVTVGQPVVSISVAEMTIKKQDGNQDPVITWNPAGATNKAYTLAGGSALIATVVGNRIHPVGDGTTTFTVTSTDGGKMASFSVTVYTAVVGLDSRPISMQFDDPDVEPDLIWTPADATNQGYIMTSQDSNVASITSDGLKIRARGFGTTTITVRSAEDESIKDIFTVQVNLFGP
ncbi:MAG: hypothetical protein ABI036_16560, partial [Fibrobacteria bacterium]